MKKAIALVNDGMSKYKAANLYRVPRETLRDRPVNEDSI